MGKYNELYEQEVVVLYETERALLVCTASDYDEAEDKRRIGEDKKAWLPKSQLDGESTVGGKGDRGSAVVPLWLAEEKGWV